MQILYINVVFYLELEKHRKNPYQKDILLACILFVDVQFVMIIFLSIQEEDNDTNYIKYSFTHKMQGRGGLFVGQP